MHLSFPPLGFVLVLASLALNAAACSEPPKTPQHKQDEVAANSLDDARLHPKEDSGQKGDPTQPVTTKIGESPASDPGSTSSGGGGGAAPKGSPAPKSGGTGAVSKAECDRVMDKFLELEISKNPELKGVPPEVIEQAKQMAREKHGDAPCSATRAQYTCAMAATTTAVWQKCMK